MLLNNMDSGICLLGSYLNFPLTSTETNYITFSHLSKWIQQRYLLLKTWVSYGD